MRERERGGGFSATSPCCFYTGTRLAAKEAKEAQIVISTAARQWPLFISFKKTKNISVLFYFYFVFHPLRLYLLFHSSPIHFILYFFSFVWVLVFVVLKGFLVFLTIYPRR